MKFTSLWISSDLLPPSLSCGAGRIFSFRLLMSAFNWVTRSDGMMRPVMVYKMNDNKRKCGESIVCLALVEKWLTGRMLCALYTLTTDDHPRVQCLLIDASIPFFTATC